MTIIQAVLLGIVQGLTEFVPISSSSHLIIIPWLFGWDDPGLEFSVAVHLGTLSALLTFFWTDWKKLFGAGINSIIERKIAIDPYRRLAWFLIIGTIPGVIVGILVESKIEQLFHQPGLTHALGPMLVMAGVVALLGGILYVVERKARHLRRIDELSLTDAVIIGTAQALAIFPGVSRSGSTITAGLAMGLHREDAARYSFLLSAPIIAGAGVKTLIDLLRQVPTGGMDLTRWMIFTVGFVTAALSGYLCIKYLLRYLQRNSTDIFVYYRWALAALIVIISLVRI